MRILVGVDGSPHALRALAWARDEAALRDGEVTAVHAFHVDRYRGPLNREVDLDDAREQARARTAELVDDTDGAPVTAEAVAVLDHRSVARVLLQHARDADLVVVGARGLGGFAGLALGSVSQQVAAHARVPVVVVPAPEHPADDVGARRPVVVGVDGSPHAVQALRWAADEAAVRATGLTAVYVYPAPAATVTAGMVDVVARAGHDDLWTQQRDEAQRALDAFVAEHIGDVAVDIATCALPGPPAHQLMDRAAAQGAMLVVGSRGRGGFAGLVLGSVSQQCLHHSRTAVAVVHGD